MFYVLYLQIINICGAHASELSLQLKAVA